MLIMFTVNLPRTGRLTEIAKIPDSVNTRNPRIMSTKLQASSAVANIRVYESTMKMALKVFCVYHTKHLSIGSIRNVFAALGPEQLGFIDIE